MSADSPRRGVHKGAQIVSPQAVSDRSIIDSVAGIINDIVPQAYTGGGGSGGSGSGGTSNADNKESITWARFEYADVNDPALYPDHNEGSSTPPLLLVLGYTTGVQVWLIAASGEATEVLSWRQGVVRTLRILPNPKLEDEYQSNNSTLDPFETKRPLVAICDSAGPGPQFCSVSFVSLKTGEQAKNIKFKNSVCDVLANRRSVVVTFHERIAVFDAKTLEDVLTVTTCYPSPGPNPNPVALGRRWLAYSEKKLLPTRRSSGGSEGEGVQSYTATVLYAAKSLGKGLRGLGETVASSLTGNSVTPLASSNNVGNDSIQPGVVTILDLRAAKEEKDLDDSANIETVIAHFTAHNDAIVAMCFDLTGALLLTADKRGHDFHVFRIQPHPGGPTLAAVHHLYVLHRGDTTAKVQDMTFSSDTRWAAVSTVRGTTHVFPVAPYGGPVGVRTHSTPHVVNRLSRFHRSAGLTDDGTRSHSPVSHAELPLSVYPYTNPRLPPYPHPTILHPLAQIRQPSTLNHINNQSQPRTQQRQRLHSEDSGALPLKICACFAPPRAWIYTQRDSTSKVTKRAVDSLFIMACHGNMIQYDLEPKPVAGIPKEKVCDDTMIELEVEAKGQWPLLRSPSSLEISPPLSSSSPLLLSLSSIPKNSRHVDSAEDRWLSQVEIVTHAGPHRRLWMGPQFVFKTYNAPSGVAVNLVEAEAIEIGVTGGATSRPARSNPVNMPHAASRPLVPVVIDGSGSSYEQSPRFMEAYGDPMENDNMPIGSGENQLREDLAEAMLETSTAPHRVPGRRMVFERVGQPVTKVVNPLGTVITVSADEEDASSQETDNNDDESTNNSLEPPKSICAEEGPASLGDFEPINEGQSLSKCNLTEICAEIRKTTEPIIDNVPDENIKEVKERKTLCARVAKMSGTRTSIDFEKEEAFKDVPTGLNICAQPGEIPDSPMTHAKETLWLKHQEEEEKKKTDIAKNIAKYVVNYDEESLVLLENVEMRKKKFLIKEEQDSVVVEDKTNPKPKVEPKKKTRKPTPPRKSSSSERRNVEEELDEDDIEHIHSSELKLNLKLSDDIEHIQISELTEPAKPPKSGVRRHSKNVLSSDDDLEHVLHSEIRELENIAKLKSARKKKSVSEGVGKMKIDDNIDDEDDDDEPIEIISIDSSQKTAEVECKIVDVRSSEVSSTMRSKKSHQKSRKIVAREPAGDEPPSSAVSRSSSSSSWSSIVKRKNTATDKPPKQLPAEKEVPVPASSSLQAKFKDSNEGDKILDESSIPETQEPSMIPVPVEDVPKVPEDVKVEKKDEQQEEEEVEVVVPPDTLETADKSDDSAVDKRSDSELESGVAPERSSSSDEVNANVVPMDTEEDSAEKLREGADKSNVTPSNSCNWSNAAKKGNRSRKKKRR